MLEALRAVVLAIWAAAGVPTTRDAEQLADVLAQVVLEDGENAPIYGSHDEDLAAAAVYVLGESSVQQSPRPLSWDAKAGVSCGAFQEPCFVVRSQNLLNQGRFWLRLMRRGELACPEQPMAPVMGGCKVARAAADARLERARGFLRIVLTQ